MQKRKLARIAARAYCSSRCTCIFCGCDSGQSPWMPLRIVRYSCVRSNASDPLSPYSTPSRTAATVPVRPFPSPRW